MKKSTERFLRMAKTSVRWSFNWFDWSPTQSDFRRAISCLQLDEKERLGKFVFRKDTRASLVGRLMMRKFINEYCGIPYEKIVFARDANNKPIVANVIEGKYANFNVSHQGNFTVLAGELRDVKLGIDIMKLEYTGGKPLGEFFRIMNRNFSYAEWQEIRGISVKTEIEQIAMFCRHWALKESYVKALGIGIVVDLKKLEFRTKSKLSLNELVTDTSLWIDGERQNWLFEETLIDSEHCVAVATRENENIPESLGEGFENLDFQKLLVNAVSLYPEDPRYSREYFNKDETPLLRN